MTPPADKRGGGWLAWAAPGVGTAGVGTWMWLEHAPIAGAIVWSVGTVAAAAVAIVKIRAGRSPEQVAAQSDATVAKKHAALAKKVPDKKLAMLLITVHGLLGSNKTNLTKLQEFLLKLFADLGASDDPSPKISDDQLRRFVGEQPDSNAETLTLAIA